jgi:acetyl-CoA carboxylase biotin carboxylase subunit
VIVHPPFRKILIANRGEIAVRIMRTCRELGVQTVAVYSDADQFMPHVLAADEAYRIGPPPSRESYLRIETLLETARTSGADAIHPGYGFLAENAAFAAAVADAGITFIGPPASAIRGMGDKTSARALVKRAGVPIIPGSEAPIRDVQEVRDFVRLHGFPVLLKAAAGGGGKGMRVVRTPDEIAPAFAQAQSEAGSAFGDDRIYVEKYLDHPRHIEVQILADAHGSVIHLGERECSIQRRHQKIIEESPSVLLDEAMRTAMGETACRAAAACGYVNAGTIEFLVDESRQYYFLEMNTRLQVEHPVTELRTGLDLVAEQLRIAAGEPLSMRQEDVHWRGHALECRICAEDPAHDFFPSSGRISYIRPAQGPGMREDRGVEAGSDVSLYYDPLLSKVIAWGNTREHAIARMVRALREYEISGVTTNVAVHLFVLQHPDFLRGEFDTGFLGRTLVPKLFDGMAEEAQLPAAVIAAWLAHEELTIAPVRQAGQVHNGRLSGWKSRRAASLRGGER